MGAWEWTNPHSTGLVTVTASSVANGHVRDFVEPCVGSFMTENIPEEASTFVILHSNRNKAASELLTRTTLYLGLD